jgi:outer membrane protein OmpA-like peptidoglycan-associated protein
MLLPVLAVAEPQFTAADIIAHFAKQQVADETAASEDNDGVVVNGRQTAVAKPNFRGVTAAGTAARVKPIVLDDGLVIPLTGAGRKTANAAPAEPVQTVAAAALAEPAQTRSVNAGYDLLITFELASATLTPQAERNLREFAVALQSPALAGFEFAVEGHTDASGSAEKNLKLSEQRAASVVTFLTSLGVQGKRLKPKGYGETRPLKVDPEDPGNRRVETRRLN